MLCTLHRSEKPVDNEPAAYNWAYEKRVNTFCHNLAIELRLLNGREVKAELQDLPKRAEPTATKSIQGS